MARRKRNPRRCAGVLDGYVCLAPNEEMKRSASPLARLARLTAAAIALLSVLPCVASARVVRVIVDRRESIADGAAFGNAGAYERLVGRIFFAFDPSNPRDRQIVDLARAPRNAAGEVEAWAEFVLLRPV